MQKQAAARPPIDVTDVDLGGDVVIITDVSGTILDVNDAFVRVTGFSRQEAIGATPRLLSSGLQQASTYERLWETVLAGEVWSGELVDRHRDGSLRTHRVTLTPTLDPHGDVSHITAVQRDLSTDLRRQVGVAGIGSLHTDPAGRCIYADDEASRLLGVPADQLYAEGWRHRLDDDDAAATQEAIERALESGREQRLDARTRTETWLHLRITSLHSNDGVVQGASLSLENVTDLIELHRRLSRRDALITALLESHDDPVAVVNPEGIVVATNIAWSRSRDEHPALKATTGDDLIAQLRDEGTTGDELAAATARHVAAQVTGVPPVGETDESLIATPIRSEEGGVLLRFPSAGARGRAATSD
jgi:PAS domain S-box-containing protein